MADLQMSNIKTEHVDLPEWVKVALEMSKKIEKSGITLPSDLAERHDEHARVRPKT
ncbi:MAG: hypothetical protein QGG64_02340 [Candidatus Latescibacteria bacterium]|jgi:hypothetical protein|nr:hypothetical protein [Candidatus Latescibacterota bacterium]